jgi:hypothetical protein
MLRVLTLLLLASAQLKIRYAFNKIYDTKVIDLSHNSNHAEKDAPGGSKMINTPSGLYLSRIPLRLPPNVYSASFPATSTCTSSVFVRFFKSSASSYRNFINLVNVRIRDHSADTQIDPRKYSTYAVLTSGQINILTAAEYPNEVWVFLAASVEYDGVTSTLKLYVNDAQVGVAAGTGQLVPNGSPYLNGSDTECIYYEFRYYWGALSLSAMQGTLFNMGTTCSDNVNACLPDGARLCNSNDAYHFDINCAACTTTNYACRDSVTRYAGGSDCTEGVANPDGSCLYPTEGDFCPVECGVCVSSSECLCHRTCQTCNFEACIACKDPLASPQGHYCVCPKHYFMDESDCQPCSAACVECSSADQCLVCRPEFFTLKTDLSVNCLDKCPRSSFTEGSNCISCNAACSTCTGPADNDCAECKEGFIRQDGKCASLACDPGTFLIGGVCEACSAACEACFGPSFFECLGCAEGLFLQPYTQSVCLETCPTGFSAQDKGCLKTADSRCSFSLTTWGQEITALSFTALRGPDKTAQRDPQPSFERGYYFDGNSELTLPPNQAQASGYLFAASFSVVAWMKGTGPILSIKRQDDQSLDLRASQGKLRLDVQGYLDPASSTSSPVDLESWLFCAVSIEFMSMEKSMVAFACLDKIQDEVTLTSVGFIHSRQTDSALVGTNHERTEGFMGFIAELTLINEVVLDLSFLVESTSSGVKPLSFASPLSECLFSEFKDTQGACQSCGASCASGCRSSEDCSLCDPSCEYGCFGFSDQDCCGKGQEYSKALNVCTKVTSSPSSTSAAHTEAQVETTSSVSTGALLIGASILGSPDMFLALYMTVDLLVYLPLIDFGFTDHQASLLQGANQLNQVSEHITGLECLPPHSKFSAFTLKCGSLLVSAQKELLVLAVAGLMFLINCFIPNQPHNPQSDMQKVKVLLTTMPMKLFKSLSLSLTTKVLVMLVHVKSHLAEYYVSYVLSILILAALMLTAIKLCALACSQPSHPVFEGLKPTKFSSLYWALVILHRLVYSVAVAGFDFPTVQLSVLTCSTLGVRPKQLFIYTVVVRPHASFKALFQQAGGLLVVGVTLSMSTVKALNGFDDEGTMDSICIYAVMGTLLVSVLALIIGTVSTVVEILKTEDSEEIVLD